MHCENCGEESRGTFCDNCKIAKLSLEIEKERKKNNFLRKLILFVILIAIIGIITFLVG